MSAPTSCGLTVLRARGRRLCKVIHPDGAVVDYDQAKLFDLEPVDLADLLALHDLLHRLGRRRDCCIVRGAVADPMRALGVRRLLHGDPDTGDLATLREEPRRWLALDLDSVPLPPGTDPRDLAACAYAVLPLLPVPFHQAAVVVSATATHGIKSGARLRLWFWCDRPFTGAECKRWLAGAPVDWTVFGSAQPIYTAHPLFIGRADHLPHRLVMLDGEPVVEVPSAAALAPPVRQPVEFDAPRSERDALGRLAGLIRTVRDASEGQRHPTLFWAACRAGELVAEGAIGSRAAVAALVQGAMDGGGKDQGKAEATARDGIARGMMEGSRHG
jgi:hypothetical protein